MDSPPREIRLLIVHERNRKDPLAISLNPKDDLELFEPILAGYRLLGALVSNTGVDLAFESSLAVPHLGSLCPS
jgi:hypothetical protein